MRNSAPGRCRYIRERSQPTASLLFFPGFLSGIRPAETNGPNDGRRTRHDIRCDQAFNQATSVRPGEQHPTVARRQTDRRMRRADRHLKNGILAGQTATRSGLSGNGPDRFLLSGAPADNDPPLPNCARDRSLAVTATYSLPADTMQTRRPKHGKRIKMANNRRHSHRELIRSPAAKFNSDSYLDRETRTASKSDDRYDTTQIGYRNKAPCDRNEYLRSKTSESDGPFGETSFKTLLHSMTIDSG